MKKMVKKLNCWPFFFSKIHYDGEREWRRERKRRQKRGKENWRDFEQDNNGYDNQFSSSLSSLFLFFSHINSQKRASSYSWYVGTRDQCDRKEWVSVNVFPPSPSLSLCNQKVTRSETLVFWLGKIGKKFSFELEWTGKEWRSSRSDYLH